jgi:hypothetical protein
LRGEEYCSMKGDGRGVNKKNGISIVKRYMHSYYILLIR